MKRQNTWALALLLLLLWPGSVASGDRVRDTDGGGFSINVGFEIDTSWLTMRAIVVLGDVQDRDDGRSVIAEKDTNGRGLVERVRRGVKTWRVVHATTARVVRRMIWRRLIPDTHAGDN